MLCILREFLGLEYLTRVSGLNDLEEAAVERVMDANLADDGAIYIQNLNSIS